MGLEGGEGGGKDGKQKDPMAYLSGFAERLSDWGLHTAWGDTCFHYIQPFFLLLKIPRSGLACDFGLFFSSVLSLVCVLWYMHTRGSNGSGILGTSGSVSSCAWERGGLRGEVYPMRGPAGSFREHSGEGERYHTLYRCMHESPPPRLFACGKRASRGWTREKGVGDGEAKNFIV